MMAREQLRIGRLAVVLCLVCSGWLAASPAVAQYQGPIAVVASPDGKTLFVANRDARQIAVVDAGGSKVSRQIAMPAPPTGLALSPDGATLYVTCLGAKSIVAIVDVAGGKVSGTIPAGHTATGPAVSPDNKELYVCNRFDNDVSIIDLETKQEIARVPVVREPHGAAVTPDGKTVFVINHLPLDPADGYDVACYVTAINTGREVAPAAEEAQPESEEAKPEGNEAKPEERALEKHATMNIRLPNGSTSMRDLCISPDGKYLFCTHILARYQMPTTQLERGWMNTNAMSIIDAEARKLLNTVLLDDVDLGAANPWGVAVSDDGSRIVVSHAGTHELSVIDAAGLAQKLLALPTADEEPTNRIYDKDLFASAVAADVPNDLAFLVDLKTRIYMRGGGPWGYRIEGEPVVNGPRGLCVVGNTAYVACYFTDNLAVVDLEKKHYGPVPVVALGPKPKMTVERRGEMLFHNADLCFQHWQSCSSCHPDARVDGLNWDLMNDGLGNPKNVRSMLLAHKTPPAMASGVRPDAEAGVRAGITHIQFAVRPEEEAAAIDEYLKALKPVPSPYLENGKLSAAAERGKKLFFDKKIGCAACHPEPLYTDLKMHDVASKGKYDRRSDFDTPTLIECWRTAPYMHDGHYLTVKELLTKGRHGEKGGDVAKLSEEQIDDLVEFVLSL